MRESKWVKTYENWYGSYEKGETSHNLKQPCPFKLGLVASILRLKASNDRETRVCVWGNDDFGMDIDFPTQNEAKAMYNSLPEIVSREVLEKLGFKRF